MSKRLSVTLLLLAIVISVLVGVMYWQSLPSSAKPMGPPPALIASTEVEQAAWQPSVRAVGSLVAVNGIEVSNEDDGIVSSIDFTSGQTVEKGQVLLRLDDAVDVAALEALRAERRLAEIQFKRASDLIKKRVISNSEFDEAEARYDASRAHVKQQQAVINRKVIYAPFSGLTGIRQVNLGQYLKAGADIVSLQTLDPVFVDYTLPERYLPRIKVGQAIEVKLDALPGQIIKGTVSVINAGVDTGSRTIKVRGTLNNPEQSMRPGMFAQVETITGDPEPVLILPTASISFNTYGNFVYVINEGDKGQLTVKRTPVETGETRSGRVAVKNLAAGTRVVRAGMVKLRDGVPVKVDNQIKLDDVEIDGQ